MNSKISEIGRTKTPRERKTNSKGANLQKDNKENHIDIINKLKREGNFFHISFRLDKILRRTTEI